MNDAINSNRFLAKIGKALAPCTSRLVLPATFYLVFAKQEVEQLEGRLLTLRENLPEFPRYMSQICNGLIFRSCLSLDSDPGYRHTSAGIMAHCPDDGPDSLGRALPHPLRPEPRRNLFKLNIGRLR